MEERLLLDGARQRETGEAVVGEPHPVSCRGTRPPVVTGPVLVDHPQLGDLGVELALAHPVVDRLQLAQHGGDAAALVPVEVGADPGAQVLRLADVYHRPVPVAEEVDAGEPGEAVAEPDLAVVRGTSGGGELQQVLEHGHPDGPRPLQRAHRGRGAWRWRPRVPRWIGVTGDRTWAASVASRRLGTSSRHSRRASAAVSTERLAGGGYPRESAAARMKERSNRTL